MPPGKIYTGSRAGGGQAGEIWPGGCHRDGVVDFTGGLVPDGAGVAVGALRGVDRLPDVELLAGSALCSNARDPESTGFNNTVPASVLDPPFGLSLGGWNAGRHFKTTSC